MLASTYAARTAAAHTAAVTQPVPAAAAARRASDVDVSVGIVGGGLAGLVLARVLHVRNMARPAGAPLVRCAVYETDASAGARLQGGELDLHPESGQAALRTAGLLRAFNMLARPEADALRVMDKHAVAHMETEASADAVAANSKADLPPEGRIIQGRPEVNRAALRQLLLDALPAGTVRWASKLQQAELTEGTDADAGAGADACARARVTLASGAAAEHDLLVGADGAWSRVRPLVSPVRPVYLGLTYVDMQVQHADRDHPALAQLVGAGMNLSLADGTGILSMRNGEGHLNVYAVLTVPESWAGQRGGESAGAGAGEVDFGDVAAVREALAARFADWAPVYRDLLRAAAADPAPVPRRIYTLPAAHAWAHRSGVTLVGDAAHLTGPSGDGANMAMLDGAELGRRISDAADALPSHCSRAEAAEAIDAAVRAYECELFPRAAKIAADAQQMLGVMFAPTAPHSLIDSFGQH